jgi:flagellar hook-length control protein FliK
LPIPAETTETAHAVVPPKSPDHANNVELLSILSDHVWVRLLRQESPSQKSPKEVAEQEDPEQIKPSPDDVTPFLIAAAFLAAPETTVQAVTEKTPGAATPASSLPGSVTVPTPSNDVPVEPIAHEGVSAGAFSKPPVQSPMESNPAFAATVGVVYDRPEPIDSGKNGRPQTAPTATSTVDVGVHHKNEETQAPVENILGSVVEEATTKGIAVPSELSEPSAPQKQYVGGKSETRESVHLDTEAPKPSSEPGLQTSPPVTRPAPDSQSHDGAPPREKESANRPDLEIHLAVHSTKRETEPRFEHAVQTPADKKADGSTPHVRPMEAALSETKAPGPEHARAEQVPATTSPSEQWSQVEKANVLSQLVEKARSLRWDRNSEIVVSLKPESLGRISLRASLVERTMVATIAAESDRVRDLIQIELPVIQRSLQESGIPARVAVSEQASLSLSYNSPNSGQSRFRQTTPAFYSENESESAGPATGVEVPDSRYSSHSVHLIA